MTHYDSLKEHLTEVETSLEEDMAPFTLQVEQLNSIYGISTTASCAIIAEIGIDMNPFKTAEHICSWAGNILKCYIFRIICMNVLHHQLKPCSGNYSAHVFKLIKSQIF